ncbi:FAD-binding protein, partial [Klebsiella michiganensis]
DKDFQRGASAYNRAQGDASRSPHPTLGKLSHGPFYAVRILPGSLGSFSGLITDENARVLNAQRQPIQGLFAIGNDMSSVMRGFYPSGGITLGPAMTFGYLVGKNLAENLNKTTQ